MYPLITIVIDTHPGRFLVTAPGPIDIRRVVERPGGNGGRFEQYRQEGQSAFKSKITRTLRSL